MKGPSFSEETPTTIPGTHIKGTLDGRGLKIALVVSRFNSFITDKLAAGACEALLNQGVDQDDIAVVWVPGAFELPLVAQEIAETGGHDAIVCLGAVIRGETAHFEYVSSETAKGISEASRDTGIPISFGVLTTDNEEQALDRAGGKAGNKGHDASLAAIEMANLIKRLLIGQIQNPTK